MKLHRMIKGELREVPYNHDHPEKIDFTDSDREFYRKKVTTEVSRLEEVRYEPLGDGYTVFFYSINPDSYLLLQFC